MLSDQIMHQQPHLVSEINTTPLVDVMLVLLVVFMVTMPLIAHSIPIDLPQSTAQIHQIEKKEPLRITIHADASFYLDTRKVTEAEIDMLFKNAVIKDKNTVIAISADEHVEYKYIVQLLTLAKDAGLTKIGFVSKTSE